MANSVGDIYNYREAAPDLATSGQPREEQLAGIADAGFEVIVNLALHDDPRYSLKDEASSVKALGLEYVHIPVQFSAPTENDLVKFFATMEHHKGRRVWVHCVALRAGTKIHYDAANMRVTAFLGLYWRIREGRSEEEAFALLRELWQPDAVWTEFIASQLAKANAA